VDVGAEGEAKTVARRQIKRLSARGVAGIEKPGRHADGGNLYLVVDPSGAKRWAFIYRDRHDNGRLRELGLGGLAAVGLADARQKAADFRKLIDAGVDPVAQRKAALIAKTAADTTFGDFADAFIADLAPGFRNAKHIAQWRSTLTNDAAPLRKKSVAAIGTADVLAVLKPIWQVKPETASRLRGRIERVLDAATAKDLRTGDNPARWRGHLKSILPAPEKLKKRGHHSAMPYAEVPAFMALLRERPAVAARALEFAILTAARTGEVLGATWAEIDLKSQLWIIPAERMKAGRPHRVPLVGRTLEIVRELKGTRKQPKGYLFAGGRPDQPLSSMALLMLLRRMKVAVTAHGFRSSFRDWAGDNTTFPRDVAEAALAHAVSDKTEAAYRRSDALAKRRELMQAWSDFCRAS
jgi:integrase